MPTKRAKPRYAENKHTTYAKNMHTDMLKIKTLDMLKTRSSRRAKKKNLDMLKMNTLDIVSEPNMCSGAPDEEPVLPQHKVRDKRGDRPPNLRK